MSQIGPKVNCWLNPHMALKELKLVGKYFNGVKGTQTRGYCKKNPRLDQSYP